MLFDNKLIFNGEVIDNRDPLMLGRIRVRATQESKTDLQPKYPNGDPIPESVYRWTSKDPFIFLPLLPYYLSQVPELHEYVHIFYENKKERTNNSKYYIQGPISRPQNNDYESYVNSQSLLASGEYMKTTFPLRSSSGTTKPEVYGIYPELGDNALLGRGTSDVVLKSDTVLVRAGKNFVAQTAESELPRRNDNWGFLQISNFDSDRIILPDKTDQVAENKPLQVKKLIEWELTNEVFISGFTAGGGVTGTTFYNGNVKMYSIIPNPVTTTLNVNLTTDLNPYKSGVDYQLNFTGLTFEQSYNLVNTFISNVNEGKIVIDGYPQFPPLNDERIVNQFPFYVKPSQKNLNELSSTGVSSYNLVTKFNRIIKLNPYDSVSGSFLVWSRGIIGQQTTVTKQKIQQIEYKPNPVSYSVLGGDNLFLISHKSEIPSKGKKIDLKDSLYGIDQLKFTEEIADRTDPMVRGNELMKLLNLIVNFLGSHVHNINKAPIPIGTDGTSIDDIRKVIQDANNTILNQNIRIN